MEIEILHGGGNFFFFACLGLELLNIFSLLVWDLQSAPAGAVLVGSMSYGMVTLNSKSDDQNNRRCPASSDISYLVPPSMVRIVCWLQGF